MGGWPPDPVKHAVRVRFTGVGGWAGAPKAQGVYSNNTVLGSMIYVLPLATCSCTQSSVIRILLTERFAADEAMEIHPDEVHFDQAKEATADMVLREMHEHVCVVPMPAD